MLTCDVSFWERPAIQQLTQEGSAHCVSYSSVPDSLFWNPCPFPWELSFNIKHPGRARVKAGGRVVWILAPQSVECAPACLLEMQDLRPYRRPPK